MKGTPDAQCRPLQDCHIAEESLALFSTFVASQMGLLFTRRQWGMLRRGICAAADEFGFRDPEACMHWLMSSSLTREQVETLAGTVTVGETYFWREEKSLDALREEVIPALMRARSGDERHLRIWSAGCSSGEEPYSIAILLHRMGTALRDWRVTIHATDINPRALARAREGIYGEWSFRTTPAWVRNGYFRRRSDGKLEVIPEIRTMVEFAYLNLADDVYPLLFNNTNAMDLILCRNVLMYFAPELAQKVVSRFHRCLVAGGWLVVSPCEISPQLSRASERETSETWSSTRRKAPERRGAGR
ncbi:MAG TPA: protein-glutamate O-methyltransferase CheR [Geobacteraceae bacterium]